MHPSIAAKQPEIEKLCRRFHVRRLEVFGSAARGADFDPEHSDADFLVELETDSSMSLLDAYLGLQYGLGALLGRPIDLIMPTAISNPFVRASIDQTRERIFGA
jgi:predicted nucleotidyltransferase